MPTILISQFGGELPAVAPHLLPAGNAQAAVNCDLRHGDLRPLLTGAVLKSGLPAGTATIFKLPGAGDWISLGYIADIILAPVASTDRRIYWTRNDGGEYPKKSSVATWPTSRRLGIPAPTIPLTMTLQGDGDALQVFDYSYVYSLVTDWGEESAPSPATVVESISLGQTVRLTGFTLPDTVGQTISKIRIYRGTKESNDFQYFFLAEIDAALTYYDDSTAPSDIGADVIPTEGWASPDDLLRGLILVSGGVLAAFKGNEAFFSEPWEPYAWPAKYSITMDHDVVALGQVGQTIIAGTKGYPYAISGSSPDSYQQEKLPYKQACLSARGMVSAEAGVIYPSHDGLVSLPTNDEPIITKAIIDKDSWKALDPESIIAAWYDGTYIAFLAGTTRGLILDPSNLSRGLVEIDWGYEVLHVCYDAEGDILGILVDEAGERKIVNWQGGGFPLTYSWRSKVFVTVPMNFGFGRVLGDYSGGRSVTFKLYGDGVLRHTEAVTSSDIFPLPGGYNSQRWEIELTGTAVVEEISVAVTSDEIGS